MYFLSILAVSSTLAAAQSPVLFGDCDGVNWLACRAGLVAAIFNASDLPARAEPDFVFDNSTSYCMKGFPGPGDGVGDVSGNSWANNMTTLVWTIRSPLIELNSTVFYTLNTSGRAPRNWPQDGPSMPDPVIAPTAISDTAIIYHNGHETTKCMPNYDGVVDYLNEVGFDVFELNMPLYGCNAGTLYGEPYNHWWFRQVSCAHNP